MKKSFGENLERKMQLLIDETESSGSLIIPNKATIKILGQTALLEDRYCSDHIYLDATYDLDALIDAHPAVENLIEEEVNKEGLELEKLAGEIWMPKETKYELIYDGYILKIFKADSVSVLVSKAIKAPEKNKILIREALAVYGNELRGLIEKYGGDLDYFK